MKKLKCLLLLLTLLSVTACSKEEAVSKETNNILHTTAPIAEYTKIEYTAIEDEQKIGDVNHSNVDGTYMVTITHPHFTESVAYSSTRNTMLCTVFNRSAKGEPFTNWRKALQSAIVIPTMDDIYFTAKNKNIGMAEIPLQFTKFTDRADAVNWLSTLQFDALQRLDLNTNIPSVILLSTYGNSVINSGTYDYCYLRGDNYNVCEYYYNTQYFKGTEYGREINDYGIYIQPIVLEQIDVQTGLSNLISLVYESPVDNSLKSVPYMITDGNYDLSTYIMSEGETKYAYIIFRPINKGKYTLKYEGIGLGCTITVY